MSLETLFNEENQTFIKERLKQLRKRLLDSSRRNPLIHTKFSPNSTNQIRFVDELPDLLRFKLENGESMRLLSLPALEEELPDEQTEEFKQAFYILRETDPNFIKEIEDLKETNEDIETQVEILERGLKDQVRKSLGLPERPSGKNSDLKQHALLHDINPSFDLPRPAEKHGDGRHEDNFIQTLMLPEKLDRSAKAVLEKSKSFMRETGVNVLQIAFGFLHWKDPAQNEIFNSPVLLMEASLVRKPSRKGAEFFVSSIEDIRVNISLRQKLETEYQLYLPDYKRQGLEEYFEELRMAAPKGWNWKVLRQASIGIFPSSKIAMYHDLDPDHNPISENPTVAELLASTGTGDGNYAEVYESDDLNIARKVPYLVVDADSSQFSALVDIANGENLSVEGPPGSGKSQSIVNMISAAMVEGKKVLFVAEKLTALEVVKNRLDSIGLGSFVLPLQATRSSTNQIYNSIQERLSLKIEAKGDEVNFAQKLKLIRKRQSELQRYLNALGSKFGSTNITLHEVIGHSIFLNSYREKLPKSLKRLHLRSIDKFDEALIAELCSDAEAFAERLGKTPQIPALWFKTGVGVISREIAEDACETAEALADNVEKLLKFKKTKNFVSEDIFSFDFAAHLEALAFFKQFNGHLKIDLFSKLLDFTTRTKVVELVENIKKYSIQKVELEKELRNFEHPDLMPQLSQAGEFARQHGDQIFPKVHTEEINSIEKGLLHSESILIRAEELPFDLHKRGTVSLFQLKITSKKLSDFPEAVLEVKKEIYHKAAEEHKNELLERLSVINKKRQSLSNVISTISTDKNFRVKHSSQMMRTYADVIEGSGALRVFSSDYKEAKDFFGRTLSGRSNTSRQQMHDTLLDYAQYIDDVDEFENDKNFIETFGEIFQGLRTDVELVQKRVDFLHTCSEIAGEDGKVFTSLTTGDLTALLSLSDQEDVPDRSIEEIKHTIETLKKSLLSAKATEAKALTFLKIFKNTERISLEEILRLEKLSWELNSAKKNVEHTDAAETLGNLFQGISTEVRSIDRHCLFAEKIVALGNASSLIAAIEEDQVHEFIDFVENLEKLHEDSSKISAQLCEVLNISKRDFNLRYWSGNIDELKDAASNIEALMSVGILKRSSASLAEQGFEALVDWSRNENLKFEPGELTKIIKSLVYKAMADKALANHDEILSEFDGQDLDRIRQEIIKTDREIVNLSRTMVSLKIIEKSDPPQGNGFGPKSTFTDLKLIFNELHKKKRRVGVRQLVNRANSALMELMPCWMMSPLAVAQYLTHKPIFDLIIIDEASQMTPENAIGAISRAKQAVIVGDTKQLPPTSFFNRMLNEDDVDEDLVEESESVLDMANVAFMPIRQFKWHYRSRHPALIEFSNRQMYSGELTIFPSSIDTNESLGLEFREVSGLYSNGRNQIEANSIVKAAIEHMVDRPQFSLGICTMNTAQKNLILDEFDRVRDTNPKVQEYLQKWEEHESGVEHFFIKNLETIQGDERDFMFISTLYGPEKIDGKVLQRFGPVNSKMGHRRLNVLFTRAKRKMITFSSMKPSDILVDSGRHKGVRMLRDWLEYSKTGRFTGSSFQKFETESPFEEHVKLQIEAMGFEVFPQVGQSGYRIDLGIKHPDWAYGFILGVECDGAAYHSSKSSRDRDRLRQEVLESYGWKLYRIWSTDWYRYPQKEVDLLREALNKALEDVKTANENQGVDSYNGVRGDEDEKVPASDRVPPSDYNSMPEFDLTFSDDPKFSQLSESSVTNSGQIVREGSKVKIQNISDGNKKIVATLVAGHTDMENEFIGTASPLGKALLYSEIGDIVEYRVGMYVKEVEVIDVTN